MGKTLRTVLAAIAFAALAFSISYSIVLYRGSSRQSDTIAALKKQIVRQDRNMACLKENYIYSSRYIADSIGGLANIDGGYGCFHDIASDCDSTVLICLISEQHCSSCTNYAVAIAKSTGYRDIRYIANTVKPRSLRNLAQSYDIADSLIFGTEAHLSDADYLMFPYCILVSKENQIKAIYIPFEANDAYDKEMLRQMIDRLNKE